MIVEEIMKQYVLPLEQNNTILDAYSLMIQHKIRHFPIVDQEQAFNWNCL